MSFDPARLRRGELIAGSSAVLLTICLFALPWFGAGRSAGVAGASIDGWHGLKLLRWLILVTVVAALALMVFQATNRAPAVPVSLSVIVTVLGGVTVLALLYRVVIDVPGVHLGQRAGAFLGLAASLGIAYGGYASMREEGVLDRDGPGEIEQISVGGGSPGGLG